MVASLKDQAMWPYLFFFLLVGLTTADHAWKPGKLYRYEIQARTLTGLHQVANQYVGIIIKAKLTIVPKSDSHISLKIHNSYYAEVHKTLNDGWAAQIPYQQLDYHLLPISNKSFEIKLRNGTVEKLIVEKNLPVWQINIIKSIASQLQIDTKATNLKKSRLNELPTDETPLGVFKTLEDSVTGKCIMVYGISPLPHHVLKSQPQLAPNFQPNSKDKVIEIIKTQNYSACQQHIMYNYGMSGMTNSKPGSNHMGQFMTRTNIGRMIITGDLDSYTIQSSQSTSKVIISPHIYNKQKGIVASSLNLTLEYIANTTESLLPISDPYVTKSLMYEYNPAHSNKESFTATEQYQRQKRAMNLTLDLKDSSNMSENFSSESSGPIGDNLSVSASELTSKVNIFDPYLQEKNKNAKFLWFGGSNNSSNNQGGMKTEPMFSDNDSSSSSSFSISNSEEFWQPQPQLNTPANVPFLPYFIGYEGYSIQAFEQIDSVSTITKLSHHIANEVQYPNRISEKNTLTKFNILVRVIRTLNTKQLVELTSLLYFNSSNVSLTEGEYQQEAWIVFYNAVAQSGTGPALVAIKHWIQNKQIESNEAARLIAALPYTATYPNEKYMNAFFTLIRSSEVWDQNYLNQSALLAFTDLIYKTLTNNQTVHNYYPVHSFGRFFKKTNDDVNNIYLPFLVDQLKYATMSNDSTNVQLYIKALGNTAHPQVINIFRPYIEGKRNMSKFQRLFAIASLDRMTKVFPNLVRPILYKLYQNPTESHEIRIAAVMQLMKTNPPPQILQQMAEYTNFDSSKEVSSTVKSIIESVAQLKTPENLELAQNARVAVNMLNPDVFGLQYSKNYMQDFVEEQRNLAYEHDFTYIQSKDSIIPKAIFFNLRKKMGSMKLENQQIAAMVSSYDVFLNMLTNQFSNKKYKYNDPTSSNLTINATMSSKDVLEMLNIETRNEEQLEGNINFEFFGGPLFLTFNKHSIEALSEYIHKGAESLENGYKFNMIKFQNKYSMSIGFPTINGLPFLYSIDIPTYLNISGEISLKESSKNGQMIPDIVNITSDINFLYCLKTQSRMGFIAPFNQRNYFTGLEKNTQIGIPIRVWSNLDMTSKKVAIKMQALNSEEKQKIFEYSTIAYTAVDNIFEIKPPLNGYGVKIIQTRPMKKFQTTAGGNTGIALDVYIESEEKVTNLKSIINAFYHENILSNWLYPYADKHIYNNNITVIFNPYTSVTKEATFTFSLGMNRKNTLSFGKEPEKKIKKKKSKHHYKNTIEQEELRTDEFQSTMQNGAIPETLVLDSLTRLNGFFAVMGSGIRNNTSIVVDASAEFIGYNSTEHYIITLGYSDSKVSESSRILLLYNNFGTSKKDKNNQVIVDTIIETSKVPLLNYKEAIEENPSINLTGKIYFGENNKPAKQIMFMGNMTRSPERSAHIRQTSIAKLCEQQMLKGNYISTECRRVIAHSNTVDELNITWKYDKIPDYVKYFIQNIFNGIKVNSYDFYHEESLKGKPQKRVETMVKYRFDYKTANITIKSPPMISIFNNIPMDNWMKRSTYFTPIDNIVYTVFDQFEKDSPLCALDEHATTTFDNTTYLLNLGNCWNVMFQKVTSKEITVLVRENGFGQREVRIHLGADIVDIVPTNFNSSIAQIKVNNKTETLETGIVNRYEDGNGEELLQAYTSPGGVIAFYVSRYGIELSYDGIRILLKVSYGYRGKVVGLCGTFDGEPGTDLTGPGQCQWADPSEFVWSYALVEGSCVGPPVGFRERFEGTGCLPKEASAAEDSAEPFAETGEPAPEEDTCRQEQRLHTFRDDGLICFSIRPYNTCSPGCGAVETANQKIDFHCLSDNAVARHWLEMVKIGATPDFSQKEISKTVEIGIPASCSLK